MNVVLEDALENVISLPQKNSQSVSGLQQSQWKTTSKTISLFNKISSNGQTKKSNDNTKKLKLIQHTRQ